MNNNYLALLLILALLSCKRSEEPATLPSPIYKKAKSLELNPDGAFVLHPISGDTIESLLNSNGDTVISGKPISFSGKRMYLNSLPNATVVPLLGPSLTKAAFPNQTKLTKTPKKVSLNEEALKQIALPQIKEQDSAHFAVNASGDTIRTGIAIPLSGRTVIASQAPLTPALQPAFKEMANANLQYVSLEQGMKSPYITSVIEDKTGALWMGTREAGLALYDGTFFKNYSTKQGLLANSVHCLELDRYGQIWMGTELGLSVFNGKTLTHFTEKEGLLNNNISCIYEDRAGHIWIGSWGGGLAVYDRETIRHFTKKEGLPNNSVSSISEDSQGNLWIGTYGGGLCKFNGHRFWQIAEADGLSSDYINSVHVDRNDNVWIATAWRGLNKYDGSSLTIYTEAEGLVSDYLSSVSEDQFGNIWIASLQDGLIKYDGETFTLLDEKNGLSNNRVRMISAGLDNAIWMATDGGGIGRYTESSFTSFADQNGMNSDYVYAILEDQENNIWIATASDGLLRFNGEQFDYFTENKGFDANIFSLYKDREGGIWIGTFGSGLYHYDGNTLTNYTMEQGLVSNSINSIFQDQAGQFWFGSIDSGLSTFNGEYFTSFSEKDGLSNNMINTFYEDPSGNIWIGTWGGGACMYNGETFINFTEKEGLSDNRVVCISGDKSGTIYFGTYSGGLSIYDGRTFTYLTTEQGLSSNEIMAIQSDNSGVIWLSTQNPALSTGKGLTAIEIDDTSKGELKDRVRLRTFTKSDGLKSLDFFTNSVLLDSRNRIWWGNNEGILQLDLSKYQLNNNKPRVYLNQLDINDQFIDYHKLGESLQSQITFSEAKAFSNYPLGLKLYHHQNHLTFNFSAVDWSAPHKIKYSFRLVGQNAKWSPPSAEPKADFRNLTFGDYIFELRAIGESNDWTQPIQYRFSILPPWWHTWWARSIYAALAILLVWFYVRWRTAKLKQRQSELESEVNQATMAIRQQKNEIEAGKRKSDELLLNILPEEVAEELKIKGTAEAKLFDEVTVLFTDFVDFTGLSVQLSAKELVDEIHRYFSAFDQIIEEHGLEKIKTIGDAYMAVCGLPNENEDHAQRVVKAALAIKAFVSRDPGKFDIRIGVNTGPVVAGIVGVKKYAYDIWGDTVNTASRMESSGEVGKVNISHATYELLKTNTDLAFEARGKIETKGKGAIEMYFVSEA
ncbi:MAG: hypothetical protein NXI09_09615 [Bacteroidetes bacterium]|nr:hypothetical protein [Bacteroidota bacterium]